MNKKFFLVLFIPLFILQISKGAHSGKLLVGLSSAKPIYKNTDTMEMTLTVLNQDPASAEYAFTSSRKYDFYMYHEKQLIWKWSNSMMFTMVLSNIILEPQKAVTYVVTFRPKQPSGQLMEPGRYKLVGAFCPKGKEFLSEPLEIEIKKETVAK
ncbi:MAG TPA: hypothetical protein DDW50_19790 [Firmicutes bacterium]|jgi:hypothetical protein|nr:hypothetical protein [Bacillota bacterium]